MAEPTIEQLLRAGADDLRAGRLTDAEARCREILSRQADHVAANQLLGLALAGQGRLGEAIPALSRTVALRPQSPEAHYNLGKALQERGRRDEAIAAYTQAIQLRPDYSLAHNNLGIALQESGQFEYAIVEYQATLSIRPDLAEAHYNLANALKDSDRLDEAIASYRRAVELRPTYAEAHANLGSTLRLKGEIDEAIAEVSAAIALKPDFAAAHNAMGNLARDVGELDEALAHYRRAMAIAGDAWAASSYLYTLHFHPDFDASRIFEEHQRWNAIHGRPLAKDAPSFSGNLADSRQTGMSAPPNPERRLRVGYVSPNFRRHPVGRFLLPLFENHDHRAFEIVCYSDSLRSDGITDRLRAAAAEWKNTIGVSDAELAHQIRQDRIDILVDLTMHMQSSRLLTFARKPAPVQVTYLAYCSTTGLETIDYRISDPYLDPASTDSTGSPQASSTRADSAPEVGEDLPFYSEKSVWLPRTYWCYEPPAQGPAVGPLPASSAGHITFGCLNNYAKVSAPTLAAWVELLRQVPGSKLIVHCPRGGHRQRVWDRIAGQGIEPRRLEFVATMPIGHYFDLYNRIDIALDPFPYAGGTTTCDALWMGVPVVSLAGQTAVARGGLSILSNVGLPELAARQVESYVQIATELAGDLSRLHELRQTLRQRMRASPLMDAPSFAHDIETAYRAMWRSWCRTASV